MRQRFLASLAVRLTGGTATDWLTDWLTDWREYFRNAFFVERWFFIIIAGEWLSVCCWSPLELEESSPVLQGITWRASGMLTCAGSFSGFSFLFHSSFGGDQLPLSEPQMLTSFFAIFYTIINMGSLLSSFGTPLLRSSLGLCCFFTFCLLSLCVHSSHVHSHLQQFEGYWFAFGMMALLMFVAIIIFLSGSRTYIKVTSLLLLVVVVVQFHVW